MSIFSKQFRVSKGEYGSFVIEETGRATSDERAALELGVCGRYELVAIPNAAGVILKSLDGTCPGITTLTIPGTGGVYTCVKVSAVVNPMAPSQPATHPAYPGKIIIRYTIVYQQVGGIP